MGSCSPNRSQKPSEILNPVVIRNLKVLTPITGGLNAGYSFSSSRSSLSCFLTSDFEAYGVYPSKFDQPFASKPVNFKDSVSEDLFNTHKIAVSCHKGLKTGPNQDNFALVSAPGVFCISVFDGHGENGHEISSIAHKNLSRTLLSSKPLNYPSAFSQTNKKILE